MFFYLLITVMVSLIWRKFNFRKTKKHYEILLFFANESFVISEFD